MFINNLEIFIMRDDSKSKFFREGLMAKEAIRNNKNLVDAYKKNGYDKHRSAYSSSLKHALIFLGFIVITLVIVYLI